MRQKNTTSTFATFHISQHQICELPSQLQEVLAACFDVHLYTVSIRKKSCSLIINFRCHFQFSMRWPNLTRSDHERTYGKLQLQLSQFGFVISIISHTVAKSNEYCAEKDLKCHVWTWNNIKFQWIH